MYIHILICFYRCRSSGYNMLVLYVPSNHQGGGSNLLYDSPYWQIVAHQSLVPHSLSLHMATGKKLRFIIGCYVSMGSMAEKNHIGMALVIFPNYVYPILVGYPNF